MPLAALVLSILIQLATAVVALSLIRLTGFKPSWLLLALALLLMVVRRILPFGFGDGDDLSMGDSAQDILALAISIGMFAGVLGIGSALKERKRAEEQAMLLLSEKERLLKEVHHRIKNNMGVIEGLLSLEAAEAGDTSSRALLGDAAGRVRSMGILYDRLYRAGGGYEGASLGGYLGALVADVRRIFPRFEGVRVNLALGSIDLSSGKLSTIGIIINELITNSMKYAFAGIDHPEISIGSERVGQLLRLTYKDNGIGMPTGFSIGASTGFGMQLVDSLVRQLHGNLRIERDSGSRFIIEFPV